MNTSYPFNVKGKNKITSSQIDTLLTDVEKFPWRFSLFSLLRYIDARSNSAYPLGRAPLPRYDIIRLGQSPTMVFVTQQIASIVTNKVKRKRIEIYDFGLFGPDGPLPLFLTEYAYQCQHQDNDARLTEFFNLFHHRLITLLYRAWADTQACISLDRSDSHRFNNYVACLIGKKYSLQDNNRLSLVCYYMSGHFTRRIRNSSGLVQILEHYFRVPVTLRENLFSWITLSENQQFKLSKSIPLGYRSYLGIAIPDRKLTIEIILGPLSKQQYQDFMINSSKSRSMYGRKLTELSNLVQQYFGFEYNWQLRLILNKNHYKSCCLNWAYSLGRNCWVGLNINCQDRYDYQYYP
ncbi:type VI secretion system baseplate subunit TssG [Candidatus Curculioniphilus buchneri]|uniref:type VI secretion system baseplate subunit TssG n=1 Tax=Candidatus Curculioniphilus buchneri TaxID=690594 RepID=UPI00376F0B61